MWQHHTAQIGDLRQHWVEAGSGPLVVLLHGFPETWFAWRHQLPALAERYRVVAPDLRGYGHTDKPMAGYDKQDSTSIEFVYRVCSFLPLIGLLTAFLPNIEGPAAQPKA